MNDKAAGIGSPHQQTSRGRTRWFGGWRGERSALSFPIWIALIAMVGGIVGMGTYTFLYAQGTAYLSDDPRACANCHIMRDVYDSWNKGSHKAVAGCNDCHTPHSSIIAKYLVKGINGFNHSWAFTTGSFREPLRITAMNRDVAQHNCVGCHEAVTAPMNHTGSKEPTDCLRCHSRVGHAR
jgi:cytochrome c nitrite reductase small subunit